MMGEKKKCYPVFKNCFKCWISDYAYTNTGAKRKSWHWGSRAYD